MESTTKIQIKQIEAQIRIYEDMKKGFEKEVENEKKETETKMYFRGVVTTMTHVINDLKEIIKVPWED